jgi:uncharacterized membrane protein
MTSKTTAAASPIDAAEQAKNFCHWTLTGVLGLVFLAEMFWAPHPAGLDVALLVLAVLVSITTLSRQMPLQNALLGVCIAGVIGSLAHGLSALHSVAIPFGPIFFHDTFGPKILDFVPWPIPLIWVVALFNSRGTARVILRPWRKLKSYGYWLIGLTAVLAMAFDFALEPFAVDANHFWSWQLTKIPLAWYGASPLNFLSWLVVALLILAFATPALIKKKPGSRSPLDLNPLALWLGAILFFAVGCAKAAVWPAVILDSAMLVVVVGFAIPGARW